MITRISVVGITIITAALVILLSAFNGIESMIEKLYSDFDTDITIRSNIGKTFSIHQIDTFQLKNVNGVHAFSKAIEETVVLKHEKKWVNASMIGVEPIYLEMSNMKSHLIEGNILFKEQNQNFGLIGATLLDQLNGFIPSQMGYEQITIYAPKRTAKIRLGSNPFRSTSISLSGRFNYNKEVNAGFIVVPMSIASELLQYNNEYTALYIDVKKSHDVENVKADIQQKIGQDFIVKTNLEKNELIYKTSKSEKLIVLFILLFIFILAAFNLIASITMLFIEKKGNIRTMIAFGANRKSIFSIFFLEGILICSKGILFGLILGYLVCYSQRFFHLIVMPNSSGEPFPVEPSLGDGILIFTLVTFLSLIFSYLPVSFLLKKNFKQIQF